jgi:hypothetical protein
MAPSSHIITSSCQLNADGDAVRLLITGRIGAELIGVAA